MSSPVFELADITIRYPLDPTTGRVGLQIFPTELSDRLVERRTTLRGEVFIDVLPGDDAWPASVIDPLAQVKILGDPYTPGFATGHTMRSSPSAEGFRFDRQEVLREGAHTTILTVLKDARAHRIEHRLSWHDQDAAFEVSAEFFNDSDRPVTLEMLASFSLGGITPFAHDDAPGRLHVHRFRTGWAAEGRLETRTLEQLHLERSWSGAGAFSERFGQVGTMPVRKWFPFMAVEDMAAGVIWGAQLAWAGSWQMEVFRQHDDVCISGGLADREFGHWMKTLAPGESIVTPTATLSCVHGSLDDLCDRLTAVQDRAVEAQPEVEQDLPIVFNEWCTTWGDPSYDKVLAIADRLAGSEVRYLVIDAGWYKTEASDWSSGHGDWVPSAKLFPRGLAAMAAAIRERGIIPGLWYEMETVGSQSDAFRNMAEHMLQRDGHPITVRERRFWNLNDPIAEDFLTKRVIDLLDECGFGYLKVDYNETAGLGSDDPDSLGEGLRKQTLGTYRFFEKIRERLPEIVIENCSSGGHRLEPSMLARTAMSSFSDAHETVEIPIIAANLHHLLLPRQNQIWAVLHAADSDRRLVYSLAATFLGRMCLSGEIAELSDAQWQTTLAAQRLYRKVVPIIKRGVSRRFACLGESWRRPRGWQALRRISADGKSALVVVHAFEGAPGEIRVPMPEGNWHISEEFPRNESQITNGALTCPVEGDFSGRVLLLEKEF
ncbi:MAG TPA: alpha-galactosidase [Chthoniobacterales bacterium]